MNVNADVFKDTRNKSQTLYRHDTNILLNNTMVYKDACNEIDDASVIKNEEMNIKVVYGGTVSTAYSIKNNDCRVAMLNFADAKRPGGWVVEGASTQEENICRCTNLYETLIQEKCIDKYYMFNFEHGIHDTEYHYNEPYTDALIYAENVAIFKDDITYEMLPVKYVDVITSPAPCGVVYDVEEVLRHRMRGIIKSACSRGVTHIVLGAWGCGAFGQDPKIVAKCFAQVLDEYPVFKEVIFAIRPTIIHNKKVSEDYTFISFENVIRRNLF